DKFNIPHADPVDRRGINDALLAGAKYLFIGCDPKPLPEKTPSRIAEWVRGGNFLAVSDAMSFHLLERAFLDDFGQAIVKRHPVSAQGPMPVEVSEVLRKDTTSRVLLDKKDPSTWKISNCSYPVSVADKGRVAVLARSSEFGRMFGGEELGTLFLRFPY